MKPIAWRRIAAGLWVMVSLAVLLRDGFDPLKSFDPILDTGALLSVISGFATWIWLEVEPKPLSRNDSTLAKEILEYSSGAFRSILNDQDFHSPVRADDLHEVFDFVGRLKTRSAYFNDRNLDRELSRVTQSLRGFVDRAAVSLFYVRDGVAYKTTKPDNADSSEEGRVLWGERSDALNSLASEAWHNFNLFADQLHRKEVF